MWFSENLADKRSISVTTKPATNYENRGDGYRDYPDDASLWIVIDAGVSSISLRLTLDQLESLERAAAAALMDAQLRPRPETMQGAAEAVER